MLAGIPEVFPFLKRERQQGGDLSKRHEETSHQAPSVKLSTDKNAYRPGDTILATIEVFCDKNSPQLSSAEFFLLENLVVQVKGIEKLDPQWLIAPEIPRGSKQRRGERMILESSPTSIVSDILFEQGSRRTYLVRMVLPKILPPTYKGTVIRYLYYFVVGLQWAIAVIENGNIDHFTPKSSLTPVELKMFINIWTLPTNSGLAGDESQTKDYWGIVPQAAIEVEIYWKEKDDENDWARASDALSEIEDEDASQSTDNLFQNSDKRSLMMSFEKGSGPVKKPEMLTVASFASADGAEGFVSSDGFSSDDRSLFMHRGSSKDLLKSSHRLADTDVQSQFSRRNQELEFSGPLPRSPSGSHTRGRSYNIRFDDQILARFSPRNPDSTYYFGDMVGGVLSFFHNENSRRCLEISAVLETQEVLNPAFIHPSRKNSPVITKVQAEYNEAVADVLQTHFVFSIPCDGPPSFTTPHVSSQWVLKFEFITTSRDIDWTQYEHPLLIEEREKGEWSMPILVHAPLPRTQKVKVRKERPSSPTRDLWEETDNMSGKLPPLTLPPNDKLLTMERLASSSFYSL
ncbi:hypothetical protein KP509_05G073300 [Ceratopteris richardii]|uniref:Reduced growth phenotype protein 1 n=1 Tax=Ceratopteris richardii TaxID=49495 RepID=A0A8T2UVJ8_CERRI|nr:hypothetical protein KP509_05G073300 [Ceratopteris richardii]